MGAHKQVLLVRLLRVLLLSATTMLLPTVITAQAKTEVRPADPNTLDTLMKFKSSLTNVGTQLDSWKSDGGTNPCAYSAGNLKTRTVASWKGILCYGGNVWGIQLQNMGLSGKVDIDTLMILPRLRIIRLDNNSFEGPLPEFGRLGRLKSLYVHMNKFSGQIPDNAFAGMGSMKRMMLAYNSFVGPVPTSVIQLPKLIELRIEGNQFTGPIPNFQQTGLKFVNVSNNNLEGPIPPSLASMHISSFTGNKDLCGKPLEVCGARAARLKMIFIVFICLLSLGFLLLIIAVLHHRKKNQRPTLGKVDSSSYNKKKSGRASSTVAVVGTGGNSQYGDAGSVSGGSSRGKRAEQAGKLSFLKDDRTRFDLQDLLRASAEVLGSGNFGSSYKALLMDGQAVVVKRFKQMNTISREEFQEHMRRMGRLQHPNLLPLVAYYYRKEEKLLVFDYIQNGSVARHLYGNHNEEQPAMNWPTRLKIVKGMAKGLAYLHAELPSLSVAHGHLKSSNVLLSESFEPMLMDYALVPAVNPEQAQHLLVAYKSPEYAENGRITKQTDVWSLGILILEILTGKFPANNMTQGKSGNHHAELTNWISSIKRQAEQSTAKLFDPDMKATAEEEKEMTKLLMIGANCCETDVGKRMELKDVIVKIEEIKR